MASERHCAHATPKWHSLPAAHSATTTALLSAQEKQQQYQHLADPSLHTTGAATLPPHTYPPSGNALYTDVAPLSSASYCHPQMLTDFPDPIYPPTSIPAGAVPWRNNHAIIGNWYRQPAEVSLPSSSRHSSWKTLSSSDDCAIEDDEDEEDPPPARPLTFQRSPPNKLAPSLSLISLMIANRKDVETRPSPLSPSKNAGGRSAASSSSHRNGRNGNTGSANTSGYGGSPPPSSKHCGAGGSRGVRHEEEEEEEDDGYEEMLTMAFPGTRRLPQPQPEPQIQPPSPSPSPAPAPIIRRNGNTVHFETVAPVDRGRNVSTHATVAPIPIPGRGRPKRVRGTQTRFPLRGADPRDPYSTDFFKFFIEHDGGYNGRGW